MHDWTLIAMTFNWSEGAAVIELIDSQSQSKVLFATGVTGFAGRRDEPWGASVSILSCDGPEPIDGGLSRLKIQIQSGDTLIIEARDFSMRTASA